MISILAGLMLQAAGQALPALPTAPTPKRRSRSLVSLGSMIRDDEYPAEALHNGVEGTVAFRLLVGPDGLVAGCTITRSSGSALLDATTCRLVSKRARFSPARDRKGRPVADNVTAQIVWRIKARTLPSLGTPRRIGTRRATAEGEVTRLSAVNAEPPGRRQ